MNKLSIVGKRSQGRCRPWNRAVLADWKFDTDLEIEIGVCEPCNWGDCSVGRSGNSLALFCTEMGRAHLLSNLSSYSPLERGRAAKELELGWVWKMWGLWNKKQNSFWLLTWNQLLDSADVQGSTFSEERKNLVTRSKRKRLSRVRIDPTLVGGIVAEIKLDTRQPEMKSLPFFHPFLGGWQQWDALNGSTLQRNVSAVVVEGSRRRDMLSGVPVPRLLTLESFSFFSFLRESTPAESNSWFQVKSQNEFWLMPK